MHDRNTLPFIQDILGYILFWHQRQFKLNIYSIQSLYCVVVLNEKSSCIAVMILTTLSNNELDILLFLFTRWSAPSVGHYNAE